MKIFGYREQTKKKMCINGRVNTDYPTPYWRKILVFDIFFQFLHVK